MIQCDERSIYVFQTMEFLGFEKEYFRGSDRAVNYKQWDTSSNMFVK